MVGTNVHSHTGHPGRYPRPDPDLCQSLCQSLTASKTCHQHKPRTFTTFLRFEHTINHSSLKITILSSPQLKLYLSPSSPHSYILTCCFWNAFCSRVEKVGVSTTAGDCSRAPREQLYLCEFCPDDVSCNMANLVDKANLIKKVILFFLHHRLEVSENALSNEVCRAFRSAMVDSTLQ
jgi:hypothetical protein